MLDKFFRAGVAALWMLATFAVTPAEAQEVVFLIRHAERDWSSSDAGLVEEGRARAENWSRVLAAAQLDVVITSEMLRTRETGAPIASAHGIPTVVVPRSDYQVLFRLMRTKYSDGRVLIVGHSSTVPEIVRRLGHSILFHISKSDYNDLFIVRPTDSGPASVIRLNVD